MSRDPRLLTSDPMRGYDPSAEDYYTRVYLTFVNDPSITVDSYLAASDDPDQAHWVLEVLEARGLVELPGDGSVLTAPPELALPAFAAEIERQARRMRASASQMGLIHRRARAAGEEDHDDAQLLRSTAEVRAASAAILFGAERSVLSVRADSARTRSLLAPENDHDTPIRSSTGNPVELSTVYDAGLLESSGMLEVLQRRKRAGEQVRLANAVPFSILVVDDQTAVLDLTNLDEGGTGSVLLKRGPLVRAVALVGRRTFDQGVPLPDSSALSPHGLSDRDLVVLTMLAAGSSDAATARQLGVSVRTVERRVRHIMDRLGTTSRLQTGVVAARQGIL